MVKVKANEVNASDDALVAKLQREVQHLREVLNLRRKGDPHDMSQQILMLKQENTRLKELGISDIMISEQSAGGRAAEKGK